MWNSVKNSHVFFKLIFNIHKPKYTGQPDWVSQCKPTRTKASAHLLKWQCLKNTTAFGVPQNAKEIETEVVSILPVWSLSQTPWTFLWCPWSRKRTERNGMGSTTSKRRSPAGIITSIYIRLMLSKYRYRCQFFKNIFFSSITYKITNLFLWRNLSVLK